MHNKIKTNSEYCKKYYYKNHEKELARKRAYYQQHKVEILSQLRTPAAKARRQKSRQKHRKYNSEKAREYYWQHKVEILAKRKTLKYRKLHNAYNRKYYQKPSERVKNRERHLKTKYHITSEDYNKLLIKQNYRCGICGIHLSKLDRKYFDVDHNHKTGQVRGLLCNKCNKSLGYFESLNKRQKFKLYGWCRRGT